MLISVDKVKSSATAPLVKIAVAGLFVRLFQVTDKAECVSNSFKILVARLVINIPATSGEKVKAIRQLFCKHGFFV